MSDTLDAMFSTTDNRGADQMMEMLMDPRVTQVTANRYNRVFFQDDNGTNAAQSVFGNSAQYIAWLNALLSVTDCGYSDIRTATVSVIEGSFDPTKTSLHGSIHISMPEITRGDPALTVRKQPREAITLDDMLSQQMMSPEMRIFLEALVRGRANILLSGGSGAGKTTMARALSFFIAPTQRVITVEEIDELHLADRLPNVVSLTTVRKRDQNGIMLRETTLEDLVRESLRMRADRIWVGETRGREAFALVKACNSGHDGSITTIHADDPKIAIRQAVTYTMEAGLPEEVARDQVAQAFHICVQISMGRMGRRVISDISELESVREGAEQRINPIFQFDPETGGFQYQSMPSPRLRHALERYGVTLPGPAPRVR